jgi:hypothetical protein
MPLSPCLLHSPILTSYFLISLTYPQERDEALLGLSHASEQMAVAVDELICVQRECRCGGAGQAQAPI